MHQRVFAPAVATVSNTNGYSYPPHFVVADNCHESVTNLTHHSAPLRENAHCGPWAGHENVIVLHL